MSTKMLSIAAAVVVGATSLAVAQTPPTTGGQSPYPNNAGAAQEPGAGSRHAMSGKATHHKAMAKHHKMSAPKS